MNTIDCLLYLKEHRCEVLEAVDAVLKRQKGELRDSVIADIRDRLSSRSDVVDPGMLVVDYCRTDSDAVETYLVEKVLRVVDRVVFSILRANFGDIPDDMVNEILDSATMDIIRDNSMASKFYDYEIAFVYVLGLGDVTVGDVLRPNNMIKKDFSDFHFYGRCEFFSPPLNDLSVYPLIVEAYRNGFARGCRAGADDVVMYLGLDCETEAHDAFLDGQHAMMRAIPHRKSDYFGTCCEVRPIKSVRWQHERVRS